MLPLKDDELKRWIVELTDAEKFRDDELGAYRRRGKSSQGAGLNLEYFETGSHLGTDEGRAPVNLAFILAKNIVPLLFPQRPKVLSFPTRRQDAASAPMAAAVLNHYLKFLKLKQTDQQVVFDAWCIGYGVTKVGYLTEQGSDVDRTPKEERKRLRDRVKSQVNQTLVTLGLKDPESVPDETPPILPSQDFVRAENPYLRWVDPFDFLMDPRARSIWDAGWVGEHYRRTLFEVKANTHYGAEKTTLKASPIDREDIPDSQLERFQTVELYELHYKDEASPTGVTVLIVGHGNGHWVKLYHEHAVYESLRGWQYSLLAFNKHNHKLYPTADLTHIRPLLDKFNDTFESVLEQVDKFVSKVVTNERLTKEGQTALLTGEIGAQIKISGEGDVDGAVRVINSDQVKQDLILLIEKILDLIILVTGLTRAQLTGLTTAQTATESQIGQAGSQNRRVDQSDNVIDFVNEQMDKLWAVVTQFVDLETMQLLTGETEYAEEETGLPKFSFLPEITPDQAAALQHGEYRFETEVTSLQRPNLEILRKQVENLAVVLTNASIHQQLALQGKMFDVAEGMRMWLKLYPELISDVNRLIRPITQNVMAGMQGTPPSGAQANGNQASQANAQRQGPPPNTADIISGIGGERGQSTPLA